MARVLISSGSLYRQLLPHLGKDAKRVELRVRPYGSISVCTIVSYTTCTELPCETRWQGGTAVVELDKIVPALRQIQEQPITLDLHDGECGNRLYAVKDRPPGPFEPECPYGWESVVFEI